MSTGNGFTGYNMYAYCGNNPVNYSDPTGQFWGAVLLGALIVGTLVGCSPNSPSPNKSSGSSNRGGNRGGHKSGTVEVNIQYTRDLSVDYGTETLIITSYTYMSIDDSKLMYHDTIENGYYNSARISAIGSIVGLGTGTAGAIFAQIESASVGIANSMLTYGSFGYGILACAQERAYQMEVMENMNWKRANEAANVGVLKVCGTYKFEGTGGSFSDPFVNYYPWDGRGEVPLPKW